MSTRLETFARDKQALLDRSAHSRLQVRHSSRDVRKALQWTRVAASVAPTVGRVAGGIALAILARLVRSAISRTIRGRA